MPNTESQVHAETSALLAHRELVNRISKRALEEGSPLTSLELQQFDSDRMSKDEYRAFSDEFEREYEWQDFLDRVSGILRRAIAEDAEKNPQAITGYDELVHQLEPRQESFSLWACCVPAISGYKSKSGRSWGFLIIFALIMLFIALMVLKNAWKH